MRLVKDDEVINLSNESHIRAFLQSGWKECGEKMENSTKMEKPKKSGRKTTTTKKQRGKQWHYQIIA